MIGWVVEMVLHQDFFTDYFPEKNLRKGKGAKSAEKWKNIGYWGDLSQLLACFTRQVLRTEIGDITLNALSRDLRTLTQAIERIGEQRVKLSARRDGCSATLISDF